LEGTTVVAGGDGGKSAGSDAVGLAGVKDRGGTTGMR